MSFNTVQNPSVFARDYRYLTGNMESSYLRPQEIIQKETPCRMVAINAKFHSAPFLLTEIKLQLFSMVHTLIRTKQILLTQAASAPASYIEQ